MNYDVKKERTQEQKKKKCIKLRIEKEMKIFFN